MAVAFVAICDIDNCITNDCNTGCLYLWTSPYKDVRVRFLDLAMGLENRTHYL